MGVACALAAAVIALVAGVEAHRQDAASLKTQEAIVRYETQDAYLSLIGKLASDANSDATFANVVEAWNADWISGEYNVSSTQEYVHGTAIVSSDGDIRFLDSQSERKLGKPALAAAAGWPALVDVRRQSAGGKPFQKKGIIVVAGRPYFASAAIVTPTDFARGGFKPYVLVFFKPAEASYYYALSAGFRARDVHIAMRDGDCKDHVGIALTDAAGVTRAWLHWQAPKPGSSFLSTLLPVLFVMLLVLAGLMAVGVTYWNKTQKKFHEAKSMALAAREEARLKTVFLGNVSHELRTPLNAIIGFAELLQMQIFGPLGGKKYEEYADAIHAGGQSMLRMVNDLIEIARIHAGDTAKEREPFDVGLCLADVLNEVSPRAAEKHLTIAREAAAQAWCIGSDISLKTALSRLLDNAIKLTDAEKCIDIAVSHHKMQIEISILDGAKPEPAENIINAPTDMAFFSNNHLEAHENIIYINFEIARGLIRLMGGTLALSVVPGTGNKATIRLPAATPLTDRLKNGAIL